MKESNKILLIHKVITGQATPEEKAKYEAWLSESSDNKKFAGEIIAIWNHAGEVNYDPIPVDKNALKSKIFANIDKNKDGERPTRVINLKKFVSIAAALLLIVAAVFVFKSNNGIKFEAGDSIAVFDLPDHSKVWLDKGSVLTLSSKFNKKDRSSHLKGNAYFEVAKNPALPFVVHTQKTKIEVVGTKFSVYSKKENKVKVNVFSGVVKFYGVDKNFLVLRHGQSVEYDVAARKFGKVQKSSPEDDFRAAYLVFNNASLEEVFSRLSNYFGVKIIIECKRIKLMKGYTSPGRAGDSIEDYFKTIEKLYPVKIKPAGSINTYKVVCVK